MASKVNEQRFTVNVKMKAFDLPKAGSAITLVVQSNDGKLGEIQIGQGTFGWKKNKSQKGFKRKNWADFARILDQSFS